jgi:hypothetical protein
MHSLKIWSQLYYHDMATWNMRKEKQTNNTVVDRKEYIRCEQNGIWSATNSLQNNPPLQSMHNWALLYQDFLVCWRPQACCILLSQCFNAIPQLVLCFTLLGLKDALQMASQTEFSRSEIRWSWTPHNWSVSSYPSTWVVAVKIPHDMRRMSRSPIIQYSHCHCQWYVIQ